MTSDDLHRLRIQAAELIEAAIDYIPCGLGATSRSLRGIVDQLKPPSLVWTEFGCILVAMCNGWTITISPGEKPHEHVIWEASSAKGGGRMKTSDSFDEAKSEAAWFALTHQVPK